MPKIELGYGRGFIKFDHDSARFDTLAPEESSAQPLSDAEIGVALDNAIDSPPLEDLIAPTDKVLIVVSDATRATGSAQVINLLVRRLIQSGIRPHEFDRGTQILAGAREVPLLNPQLRAQFQTVRA